MIDTKIARQALDNWPGRYTNTDIRLWYEKMLAEIECSNLINDRWTCGSHEYSKQEYPDGCPYCEMDEESAKLQEALLNAHDILQEISDMGGLSLEGATHIVKRARKVVKKTGKALGL